MPPPDPQKSVTVLDHDQFSRSIDKVATLVRESERARVIDDIENLPDDMLALEFKGVVSFQRLPRGPIHDHALSLAGFAEQVNDRVARLGDGEVVRIFVEPEQARAYWQEDRRDCIILEAPHNPPFMMLCNGAMQGLEQPTIVELLRTTFRGHFVPPEILSMLKAVNFSKLTAAQGEVGLGRENVSKQVLAELANADKLPDTVLFSMPVFEDLEIESNQHIAKVQTVLQVDVHRCRFSLTPLPGEIICAKRRAMEWVAAAIRKVCPKATVFQSSVPA